MYTSKLAYFKVIDSRAKDIADDLCKSKTVTSKLLGTIIELYQSAKVEHFFSDGNFESAYHSPITGDLEFLIARILYHYSILNNKNWSIALRRQKERTAPDIRLSNNGQTFAIIEVKAKAGWIQPFLSPDRFNSDKQKFENGQKKFNPETLVANSKNQLKKYIKTFNLSKNEIFFLLPSLALVHKKKYKTDLDGYYQYFESTSGLPVSNFILLSSDMNLHLYDRPANLAATNNFENMIQKISSK